MHVRDFASSVSLTPPLTPSATANEESSARHILVLEVEIKVPSANLGSRVRKSYAGKPAGASRLFLVLVGGVL